MKDEKCRLCGLKVENKGSWFDKLAQRRGFHSSECEEVYDLINEKVLL